MVWCLLGSVYGGPGAEGAAGQAERRCLQPAPSDPSGTCHGPHQLEPKTGFKPAPLVPSAETREEKRRGAAEEGVGGPGAGENPGQITVLQRGQALLLSLHLPAELQRPDLFITPAPN